MKNILRIFSLSLLLAISGAGWISPAGSTPIPCSQGYAAIAVAKSQTYRAIPDNSFLRSLSLSEKQKAIMATAAEAYGVRKLEANSWRGVINEVYQHIGSMPDKSGLEKGELMARFAADLDTTIIEKLSLHDRKTVNYAFGLAVTRLEAFSPTEFLMVGPKELSFSLDADNVVSFDRYLDYTKRYLKGDTGFIQGGFIQQTTIRDMEALNRFPAYIEHDMRHIHYATGHPRAAAVLFSSARSSNSKRYTIEAAAYEAVDTVQFEEETALAMYFDKSRRMDIEEGMTYISRATDKELERIIVNSGEKDRFIEIEKKHQESGWRPKALSPEQARGLDEEVDNMVETFAAYQSSPDPETKQALKYSNLRDVVEWPFQNLWRRIRGEKFPWGAPRNNERKNY